MKRLLSSAYVWSFCIVALLGILGSVFSGTADAKRGEDAAEEEIAKLDGEKMFSFGGPREVAGPFNITGSGDILDFAGYGASEDDSALFEIGGGALQGVSNISGVLKERNGVKTYRVQKGDTPSGIAASFGLSLDTIQWANPGARTRVVEGTLLAIPPVDGVLYEVRSGDSLESVAAKFRVRTKAIAEYNAGFQKLLDAPGANLVIPHGKPLSSISEKNLPDMKHYFALPARGWNWGMLHFENAVDIADKCGSPIYASAEGLVTESSADGSWNDGYGNLVVIEHPNGTETRYAHIQESFVTIGDYVSQGTKIAAIGSTGNTHGPTGCHLHFEIVGAKNPFALR